MKKLYIIILFYSFNVSFSQDNVLPIDKYQEINSKRITRDTVINIFSTDLKKLEEIINDKKKIKFIYSFSIFCKISKERFPIIKEFLENKKSIELIVISSNRYDDVNLLKRYFSHYKFYSPIFILDTQKYGNKKDPSKRNDLMVKYLCKDCNPNSMGFSDFFIKDINGQVLYKSAYETTIYEMKEEILKLK